MVEISQWGTRSQRSIKLEEQLKRDLERCQGMMLHFSKHVAAFESQVQFQVDLALRGDGMADFHLPQRLHELEGYKLQLAAYKDRESSLEKKISEISNPSPEQIEETARHHAAIRELVAKRLETDRQADRSLQELSRLLQARAAETLTLGEAAKAADFTLGPDGLDDARFKALADTLPHTIAATSDAWVKSFLENEH